MKKFLVAFLGIKTALKESSVRLQVFFAIGALVISRILNFTTIEMMILIGFIALVIVSELVNEAIERICDRITTEKDNEIKEIKDIAAGAVLVASFLALIVGIMMIINHL